MARGHMISSELVEKGTYTSVCEIDSKKRDNLCAEYGLKGYADFDDMLKNEELDILIIGTPHAVHLEPAVKAMEKGVNVLIEKPLEVTLDRCQKIIDAEKRTGAKVYIGHMQRFINENVRSKQILESKRLGDPFHIHDTIYMQYFTQGRPKWFHKKEISGGGIIWTHGCHQIDRNSWMFGSRVEKVFADIRYHETKTDLDSHVELLLYFENGAKSNIQIDGYCGWKNEVEIFCSNGFIKYSQGAGMTVMENVCDRDVYGKNTVEEINFPEYNYAFATEVEEFIDLIDSGKEITLSSEYGMYIVAVIEAAYKSGREQRIVKMSEVL